MSLSAGLNIARSSLAVASGQTEVVSRNIANVNDPNYRRKSANLASLETGGVHIASIARTANQALFTKALGASSAAAMYGSLLSGLQFLSQTVGDPEDDASPAAAIGKLASALQLYSTTPSDAAVAASAVGAARDLANALNVATDTVQGVRAQADADMATTVDRINSLLGQLETVNAAITGANQRTDITDNLDARDKILSQLSNELGIRVVERAGNDITVYTDSGVTLFDGRARSVTMQPTSLFTAGVQGSAVFIDGVQVTGQGATMGLRSGALVGLAQLRDEVAPTYQKQLDEIARGLIETFAESDQGTPPSLPGIPGLFTWPGAPAMPAAGSVNTGLAGLIRIAASVDPNQGGNASLLRDGGIGDPGNPAYTYNSTGAAGFSERLRGLLTDLTSQRGFDAGAGLGATATLAGFASSSSGWLEQLRSSSSSEADYRGTLLTRANDALSKATGVNLDEEMTLMLDLERSYQASAKLIATIDSMFAILLESVG
ncbi:MAG: flagellar hook-associated protein FlgK [Parvibaculaceae bacterium]